MTRLYINAIGRDGQALLRLGYIMRVLFIGGLSCILLACRATPPEPIKTLHLPLADGQDITSIALIHNQKHRGLNGFAVALGQGGAVIYDMQGQEIWRDLIPAKLVAYDGRALLIYRDHEDKTILDRYAATDIRYIIFEDRQSPSEIAATTLQRTAFASLGPVTLSDSDANVLSADFKSTLRYRSQRPIAAVASTSKAMPSYPNGVVLVTSSDGYLELFSTENFKSRLE